MPRPDSKKSPPNGSALGFEATLWSAAEKLKGNMDAGEYKHVVLGLIFLKYISDAFEERHAALAKDKSADAEDRDEYTADNIFWVNKIARWSYLQGRANPPFNDDDWGGDRLREDVRWKFGVPPTGNANFAWVQHFIHHLSPTGMAGFVLANGSMSSNQSGEGEIRQALVEADLVDCMVSLPGQLFYSTQIPVCLWFISRDKRNNRFKDRRGKVLFVDGRKFGTLVDRAHRELSDNDIAKIANTYHAWRGDKGAGKYEDTPGFCKSVTLEEIGSHGHVLTPGRYVGAEDVEDNGEPFDKKMKRLVAELDDQVAKAAKLDHAIGLNLDKWRTR